MKFNPFAATVLILSVFFMNYKLSEVGVPDAIVIAMSIAYYFLFPWRPFTSIEKGETPDETSK